MTLNAPQNFGAVELKAKELVWKNQIRVGGAVNGFKLQAMRENTLMVSQFSLFSKTFGT